MDSGVVGCWDECWVEDTVEIKVLVVVCSVDVEIQVTAGKWSDGCGWTADKEV